jgi:hypothetical protein
MMKTWALEMSLWLYGLMFSMIGGSFVYLSNQKQDKGLCEKIHNGTDQRIGSVDKKIDYVIEKLDKLYDLHLEK